MNHQLPTDLLQKILHYLASKAYSEVASLVTEIQQKAVLLPPAANKPQENTTPTEVPLP